MKQNSKKKSSSKALTQNLYSPRKIGSANNNLDVASPKNAQNLKKLVISPI